MNSYQSNKNLDSILFYSGPFAQQAATELENRNTGAYIESLGYLRETEDKSFYWDNYPDIIYTEQEPGITKLSDIFEKAHSYLVKKGEGYNIAIKDGKYNALYSYEDTVHGLMNNFDTARIYPYLDVINFMNALNEQTFNQQSYYKGEPEVSAFKIGQTQFEWHKKDEVYRETPVMIDERRTYDYSYIFVYNRDNYSRNINEIIYDDYYYRLNIAKANPTEEELANLPELGENEYYYTYHYSYDYQFTGEGEPIIEKFDASTFYSYTRGEYNTMTNVISSSINAQLDDFEERRGHNTDIYAYYMYDCNVALDILFTSKSLGVKKSTLNINFDSKFNNWFDNIIKLDVVTEEAGHKVAKLSSSGDDEVFAIRAADGSEVCGPNQKIDTNESAEFYLNSQYSGELNIMTPYKIKSLDLSSIKTNIIKEISLSGSDETETVRNILLNETNWVENKGSEMKSLILGGNAPDVKSEVTKILGINDLLGLELVDISGFNHLRHTPSISKLENLKVFNAAGSNITSFRPVPNITMYDVSLPDTIQSLKLIGNKFETGAINLYGTSEYYYGKFDYTPSINLASLTLKNIDDKLSYRLVSEWYDVLKNNSTDSKDLLDAFLYLELNNFNWEDVRVERLLDLRRFDINPNINGNIYLIGSGNYGWLSREDYRNITKLYGINAIASLREDTSAITNKVYNNLNIYAQRNSNNELKTEKYEFFAKIHSKNVDLAKDYINNILTNAERNRYSQMYSKNELFLSGYEDTLDVVFGYDVDEDGNPIGNPYTNRAANDVLDILYSMDEPVLDFQVDEIDKYLYCNLPRSIDTKDSELISDVKAGDIMLFNGNMIMIFFEDFNNPIYQYYKIGHINNKKLGTGTNESSILALYAKYYDLAKVFGEDIQNSFVINPNGNNKNIATLEFSLGTRPVVIEDIVLSMEELELEAVDIHNPIELIVNIANNHGYIVDNASNKKISYNVGTSELNIEDITEYTTEDHDSEYPKKYRITVTGNTFESYKDLSVEFYADENPEDTKKVFKIKLKSEYVPSYVDDNDTLILDSNIYHIENDTLILDIDGAEYDENTETMTLI